MEAQLPPSLEAHTPEELSTVAAEAWNLWVDGSHRELQSRRQIRQLQAQVRRLQGRLRFQHAMARRWR